MARGILLSPYSSIMMTSQHFEPEFCVRYKSSIFLMRIAMLTLVFAILTPYGRPNQNSKVFPAEPNLQACLKLEK